MSKRRNINITAKYENNKQYKTIYSAEGVYEQFAGNTKMVNGHQEFKERRGAGTELYLTKERKTAKKRRRCRFLRRYAEVRFAS